jgi:hypothetical protein
MADDIFGQLSQNVPQAIDSMASVQSAKNTRQTRATALQGALGGTLSSGAVGQLAGATVSEQGTLANKATTQKQQVVGQLADQALQGNAIDRKAAFQQRKIQIDNQTRSSVEQLRTLDNTMATRFFDEQLKFQKDEIGRTVFTEQQLMDYAVMKFKRDEDFSNYKQSASQMSDRRMQLLKAAHMRIDQTLKQTYETDQQAAQQEQTARLVKAKADIQRKIEEQANSNAERGVMFSALGTIVGAVAGSVVPGVGTAIGATVGAAIGGAAGSALGAATMDTTKISPSSNVKPTVARPIKRY